MNKPTICVDFDGTIREDSKWTSGAIPGDPLPDALIGLKLLSKRFSVYIYTSRVSPHWGPEMQAERLIEVLVWLTKHGFVKGKHYKDIIGYKLPALAYIDDKAIHFDNWDDIIQNKTWLSL